VEEMKHELKMLPKFFQVAWAGDKPFEIRKNDRNFTERDEVALREWNAEEEYTGREIHGFITYITTFQQRDGYVVFSYKESWREE